MADTTITAGGVALTVTKTADGQLAAFSPNYPGVSFDGSGGPGHAGFALNQDSLLQSYGQNREQRDFYTQNSIKLQAELTKVQQNPAAANLSNPANYEWYVKDLQSQIANSNQKIDMYEQLLSTQQDLLQRLPTITAAYNAANPDGAVTTTTSTGEPKTTETDATNSDGTPKESEQVRNVAPEPVDEFGGLDAAIDQQQQDNALVEFYKTPEDITNEDAAIAALEEESRQQAEENYDILSEPPVIPDNSIQGTPYDDEGNLMPGWTLDEDNNPVYVGGDFVEPATQASAEQSRNAAKAKGTTSRSLNTNAQASAQDAANALAQVDWRVKLQLAPESKYLYKNPSGPGILKPLLDSDGVIFPYTPSISVNYAASYGATEITHSNYKIQQYQSSSVDSLTISCDFTAQDTFEANYLLAVIHFFRSVTKMFYGQDQNPTNGTPPPLCYLTGLGAFQFDRHPLAITSFNYSLPTDVDYIQSGSTAIIPGQDANKTGQPTTPRQGTGIAAGGTNPPPAFNKSPTGTVEPTYVPTKMSISITAVPIVSRNDISNRFSLRDYATGALLRGSKNNAAGIW